MRKFFAIFKKKNELAAYVMVHSNKPEYDFFFEDGIAIYPGDIFLGHGEEAIAVEQLGKGRCLVPNDFVDFCFQQIGCR